MKNKYSFGRVVAVAIFLVYTLSFVSSVNVGISPGIAEFKDVVREGYAERYIAVSADSVSPVKISLIPRGEIENWISYPVESFEVSKDNPYYLKLSITPPADTPNGNYTGFLKFLTESNAEDSENHAVGKIRSSLDLSIKTSVTDVEYVECSVENVKILSAEKGDDVLLSMDVLNLGNIRLSPSIIMDIWDRDQVSILKSESLSGKSILPTIKESLFFKISSSDLELGQYWGDLSVLECLSSSLLTFDVLEEGAVSAKGILLNILAKKDVKTKETVPFEVSFKNVGEKTVTAEFKGKVTNNGKIVQVFNGEKLEVNVDTIEKFLFYFTPQKEGKYVISGRVYYDSKRTFESSFSLNVTGSGFSILPIVYSLLILFVVVLLYRVRMEKKLFKEKLKRLKWM